eukprot:CAMPEP_0204016374 /NCGR_PEP_ID=MMETSP0360-20130528/26702_1 /ASSEMBLY_ACC=CAM_ASM_000342 /TAXON_ID=268821 /ORGANISM="Scrippsiella Hangoei, Strain SHTV-5" /LENGTH=55 /DNA_ID=CAMNT_0050959381 /DNA_START=55 /DNA_END=220 /DNA_ORIENTATION=-
MAGCDVRVRAGDEPAAGEAPRRGLGRLDEAQEFADRCLDEHPDSPEAAGFARDLE